MNACIVSSRFRNGLYVLDGFYYKTARTDSVFVVETDKTAIWHLRLGHVSQKGLQVLCNQGLLGKVSVGCLDFCETCTLSKQHRLSFLKGTHLPKACLEYIHADLGDQLRFQLTEVTYTFYPLLMIIVEKFGFFF